MEDKTLPYGAHKVAPNLPPTTKPQTATTRKWKDTILLTSFAVLCFLAAKHSFEKARETRTSQDIDLRGLEDYWTGLSTKGLDRGDDTGSKHDNHGVHPPHHPHGPKHPHPPPGPRHPITPKQAEDIFLSVPNNESCRA
jgi:hypothetical protein